MHRDAVEDRLPDQCLDVLIVGPVVDRDAGVGGGDVLPRRARRVALAVRETHHAGRHVVAHTHRHRSAVGPALQDRDLAVAHLGARRVFGVDEQQAAFAARNHRRHCIQELLVRGSRRPISSSCGGGRSIFSSSASAVMITSGASRMRPSR
jgi:hypothetical protein